MNKKNAIILVISIVLLGLLIFGGTYAYWSWTSNTNKNVVFNTAKELIEYVEYDDGESTFLGDFKVSSSYNQGIHSTISIKKKDDPDVANVDLVATIKMDINGIGNNMKQSTALKWVVTSGTSSNIIEVLASGNFVGTNTGDVLTLYPNVPVTTTKKDFTVWIWLDASENPSELLTGETLDTVVWTQIDQVEGVQDSFEITRINANYQVISATAVNSKYKIIDYAVTTTDTQPSSWAGNIASANQSNVYTLKHTVSSTGTYYVWFKDSNNNTVRRSVQVTTVDNTAPTCTFGSWNKSSITNNNIATINLTCVDTESGFINSDLQISDFNVIVSNASASLTSINKVSVTNGYQYTLTLKGVSGNGTASIKLYSNKVKNSINLGNSEANSSTISVFNSYIISYNLDGGSHSISCGISTIPVATMYGVDVVICNPTKEGYTFVGWTSSSNDGLESNAKTGTASNPSTTWNGTATTNTYFKNLRTTSGTVTLTATWESNYQNVDTGIYYKTLADALSAVESNQTIKALNGNGVETSNSTLASGKTGVKFDLNGQTVSVGTYYIYNLGELDIYNSSSTQGVLEGANTDHSIGVIRNGGTLTTNGTSSTNPITIRNTSDHYNARVIRNDGGTVTLNTNSMVTFAQATTGTRYLINNGGIFTIVGANLINNISSSTYDCGIINNSTSSRVIMTSGSINTYGRSIDGAGNGTTVPTISITGGTITSSNGDCIFFNSSGTISITGGTITGGGNGIYMASSSTGTLIMGIDEGGTPSTTSPVVSSTASSGTYYGVNAGSSGTFNFYDGKVTSTRGVDYTIDKEPDDLPDGYDVSKNTVDGIGVATLTAAKYKNVDTGVYYNTLYDALAAVQSNETIKVYASMDESSNTAPTLALGKTGVKLDLNGKTITLGDKTLTNNGELDIYTSKSGAVLQGSNTTNTAGVIKNNGTLTTNATNNSVTPINNMELNIKTTKVKSMVYKPHTSKINSSNLVAIDRTVNSNTLTIQNTGTSYNCRVIYNLAGKTVTLNANTTLTFPNANSSTNTSYSYLRGVINTLGILNINGATITNNPGTRINNIGIYIGGASGRVVMSSGTITASGYGIYNYSGTGKTPAAIQISNGTIESEQTKGIYNNTSGTINVTGGTITGTNNPGIYSSSSGILNLGEDDSNVNISSPTIYGGTNAIYMGSGNWNYYDGALYSTTDNYANKGYANTVSGYIPISETDEYGYKTYLAEPTYVATIYYNSNTSSGSTTVSSVQVGCITTEGNSTCEATIPTAITSSVGTYNNAYAGLATSTGIMTASVPSNTTTLTLSADTTYYAIYSTPVTIYYPDTTTTRSSATVYRNQCFTSTSAMAPTILSTTSTGAIDDYAFTSSVSGYDLYGFATSASSITNTYAAVTNLKNSNATTAYAILYKESNGTFYYYDYDNSTQATTTATGNQYVRCTASSAEVYDGAYTVPSEVIGSIGPGGNVYQGLSTVPSSTTTTTTINTSTTPYYAVYGGSFTATFTKENSNVTSIGSTSLSCNGTHTTNGTAYSGTTCSITLPNITVASGYDVLGWFNGLALIGQPNTSYTLTSDATYTARAGKLEARNFYYDNTNSGVECNDVQCMIDYLDTGDQSNTTLRLGDYVRYVPSKTSYTTDMTKTGYTSTQTINPSKLTLWRVISLNQDGTVDIISENVSSQAVYFRGQTGYQNFVGYLNVLASQYETSGITIGSRHFGYNGQTLSITNNEYFTNPAPWTCSTGGSCLPKPDDYEAYGGGDTGYLTDYNLVNTVLGTRVANKVGTSTATTYWMASRYYRYSSTTLYSWDGRYVSTSGSSSNSSLYIYISGWGTNSLSNALRPIVTLKSGLSYTGSGSSSSDPRIISTR